MFYKLVVKRNNHPKTTTHHAFEDFRKIDEIINTKYSDEILRGCLRKSEFPTRVDFNNLNEAQ